MKVVKFEIIDNSIKNSGVLHQRQIGTNVNDSELMVMGEKLNAIKDYEVTLAEVTKDYNILGLSKTIAGTIETNESYCFNLELEVMDIGDRESLYLVINGYIEKDNTDSINDFSLEYFKDKYFKINNITYFKKRKTVDGWGVSKTVKSFNLVHQNEDEKDSYLVSTKKYFSLSDLFTVMVLNNIEVHGQDYLDVRDISTIDASTRIVNAFRRDIVTSSFNDAVEYCDLRDRIMAIAANLDNNFIQECRFLTALYRISYEPRPNKFTITELSKIFQDFKVSDIVLKSNIVTDVQFNSIAYSDVYTITLDLYNNLKTFCKTNLIKAAKFEFTMHDEFRLNEITMQDIGGGTSDTFINKGSNIIECYVRTCIIPHFEKYGFMEFTLDVNFDNITSVEVSYDGETKYNYLFESFKDSELINNVVNDNFRHKVLADKLLSLFAAI